MARPLRIQFEGATYHVTIRGVSRPAFFRNDADRERFIVMLDEAVRKHDVRVHAFCLFRNDVDLVVETPRGNVADFMQGLQTAYLMYYSRHRRNTGAMVRDRYRAKVVEPGVHFLRLTRHVHLIPVQAPPHGRRSESERRRILRRYRWSSYAEYIGQRKKWTFVVRDEAYRQLRAPARRRAAAYAAYVEEALARPDAEFEFIWRDSPISIGSPAFNKKLRQQHKRLLSGTPPSGFSIHGKRGPAVSRRRVMETVCRELGVPKSELFRQRKGSFVRPIASFMLKRHSRLPQEEIAECIGVGSGAAISVQIRRLLLAARKDDKLRRTLDRIERRLA